MAGSLRHREINIPPVYVDWRKSTFRHDTLGSCTVPPTSYVESSANIMSGTIVASETTQVMDDVVTPQFEVLRSKGKIINNPMTKSHQIVDRNLVSFEVEYYLDKYGCVPARYYPYRDYGYKGTMPTSLMLAATPEFLVAPSLSEESMKDRAISSAWANIGHDKMLLLATMAEFDKSLVGLWYILKKVYRIQRALHKADLKVLKKELKPSELVEIYMNARYNLRPLYYDVKGVLEVLAHSDKPPRQTFRSRVFEDETSSDTISYNIQTHAYLTYKCDILRTSKVAYTVRAGVLTEVQKANLGQLLGLDSVIESAWDLLPFSFIIDWFVNVGTTLSSWTPDMGFHALTSWVTLNKIVTQNTTVINPVLTYQDYGGYYHRYQPSVYVTGGTCSLYTRTFERIPDYSRPLLPTWQIRLSAAKLLDLAIISSKLFDLRSLNRRFR